MVTDERVRQSIEIERDDPGAYRGRHVSQARAEDAPRCSHLLDLVGALEAEALDAIRRHFPSQTERGLR